MRELGLVMRLQELGVTQEMLPGIVQSTLVMRGGYKELSSGDILAVLEKSM